jgi:uncharacterized radical SAM superfamily Fe-S cluster-containing enzyme
MKERIDKPKKYITIKNFFSAKGNVKRIQRKTPVWEKIFQKNVTDTGLLSKICKKFLKFNNKKMNNLF